MKGRLLFLLLLILITAGSLPSAAGIWVKQYENNFPSSSHAISKVFFINSQEGWATGNFDIFLKTTNRGLSWEAITSPFGSNGIAAISAVDSGGTRTIRVISSTIEGFNTAGSIETSTNNGASWTATNFNDFIPLDIWFLDGNNGFISGWYYAGFIVTGRASRTSTGGTEWASANLAALSLPAAIHARSANHAWVAGFTGYVASWEGSNWTDRSIAAANDATLWRIQSLPSAVWAAGNYSTNANANLYKSTDGGSNWTGININSLNLLSLWFVDNNNGWVGDGSTFKLFHTTNGGNVPGSWTEEVWENSDALGAIRSLYFTDLNNGWAAGNTGSMNYILKYVVSPEVATISPSSGESGASQNVTIAGTNFQGSSTDKPTLSLGSGIVVNLVTYESATQFTANISLPVSTSISTCDVTVTNPDRGRGRKASSFTIIPSSSPIISPEITTLTPSTCALGAVQNIVITGKNFQGTASSTIDAPVVSFEAGSGITVNLVTYESSTQITANIAVSNTASSGAHSITVRNSSGGVSTKTNALTLLPVLSGIDPAAKPQGWSGTIEASGYGFQSGATLSFSGSGLSASTTSISTTKLTALLTIESGAAVGGRSATVTNPDGGAGTYASAFYVQSSSSSVTNPTITLVAPDSAQQGSTETLTITGTGFKNGAIVSFSPGGIKDARKGFATVEAAVASETSLTISISIDADAAVGERNVTVTNTDEGSGTASNLFSISSATASNNPSIFSLSNYRNGTNEVWPGENTIITFQGVNLPAEPSAAEIVFSPLTHASLAASSLSSGITVNSITSISSDRTKLYATISVASNAESGYRNVIVKNKPGGVLAGQDTLTDALKVVALPVSPPQQPAAAIPSQSKWNPGTESETTVQVRVTPGYALPNGFTVKVTDSLGRIVYEKNFPDPVTDKKNIKINRTEISEAIAHAGMYLIVIIDNRTGEPIGRPSYLTIAPW